MALRSTTLTRPSLQSCFLAWFLSIREKLRGLRGECEQPPLPFLSAWIGLDANQLRDDQTRLALLMTGLQKSSCLGPTASAVVPRSALSPTSAKQPSHEARQAGFHPIDTVRLPGWPRRETAPTQTAVE